MFRSEIPAPENNSACLRSPLSPEDWRSLLLVWAIVKNKGAILFPSWIRKCTFGRKVALRWRVCLPRIPLSLWDYIGLQEQGKFRRGRALAHEVRLNSYKERGAVWKS